MLGRWFLGCLVALGCALGGVGCVSPQSTGEAAASSPAKVATSIAQGGAELVSAFRAANDEVIRQRLSRGVSPELAYTGQEVTFIVASLAPVALKILNESGVVN